jgi:protein gp37
MYKRFKWNPELYRDVLAFMGIEKLKPSRIFVGSTMELFGDWIEPNWMLDIFDIVKRFPRHTFIFLTKQPHNLIKWSPFPENCWVGVSVTDANQQSKAYIGLKPIQSSVKFISYEPLLDNVYMEPQFLKDAGISWVIIGQQTPVNAKTMPHIQDIQRIMENTEQANIPIFLKNNLSGFKPFRQYFKGGEHWKGVYELRQEFPVNK